MVGIGSIMRNSNVMDYESQEDYEGKKMQKRVQLRQLLKNKFKNKYLTTNCVTDPELACQIQQKIDGELQLLFDLEKF